MDKLTALSQLLNASLRPLPSRYGDGRYDSDVSPTVIKTGILKDLASQAMRVPADINLMIDFLGTLKLGGLQDDSQYLMEQLIQFVSSLPKTSLSEAKITDGLVTNLWNVMLHPPLSYVGDQYQYRHPEGAYNSIMYPHLGKAFTAYAKSVKPVHPKMAAPPDPGVLFDALMARRKYKEHPNKISSVLFYFATVVIHDLFRSSHDDPNISQTSSYLDLSPLYGSCQGEQNSVRTFVDGKLKPDTFSEVRILGFPPGVSGLLISFNRFHNYVVGELADINEGGRFSKPVLKDIERKVRETMQPPASEEDIKKKIQERFDAAVAKRDNDLFQTGRLVTCGMYINIIMFDYVRAILGLNLTGNLWELDIRALGPHVYSSQGAPMGIGNQVSCEFNLLYRWHSAISDRDDKWTTAFTQKLFPGKDIHTLSLDEYRRGLGMWLAKQDKEPSKRNLDMDNLVRGPDGKFDDAALVKVIQESIEDCAAAYDSGVPLALRLVEVLGIEQARTWKTGTLNELRRFLGLIEHKTFEEINPDPRIHEALRQLYDHPDNVEMYPGMMVEYVKKPMAPGAGLCPPQVVGKGLLSDAVALVRGDRFYTVDYTPAHLTQFGYNLVEHDPDVAHGGGMYKLLMKAFPGWFEYNSVYALYPLTIPKHTIQLLTEQGIMSQYSPNPPKKPAKETIFSTKANVQRILGDQKTFKVVWGEAISRLSGGVDYMLSADKPANTVQRNAVIKALYTDVPKGMDEVWDFYIKFTEKLLAERSYKLGNFYQVDAARDVINMVQVNFVAQLFDLPLKTDKNPRYPFTEKQLYDILALLFGYVFLDRDEAASFKVRKIAAKACEALSTIVKFNVKEVSFGGFFKKLSDNFKEDGFLDSYGNEFIRRLLKAGKSVDEITWIIMPTAAAATANQGQQSIQMLDVYLQPGEYSHHWPEIVRLAKLDDADSRKKLRKYALEACRISSQSFGLFRRVAEDVSLEENGTTYNLKAGDEVFANLVGANVDSHAFPNPLKIDITRPEDSYINYGFGPHSCIGKEMNIVANTAILRCFARLPNLRPAPGPQGKLKYVIKNQVVKAYMQEDWGSYWYFPTTMKVHYDAK